MSINTFLKLFHRIMERTRIPFTGEPLAGLQVMGLLETRVIDFRNVIFLSMNEGLFPRTTISHSFIPHFLRYGFGLPTLEHQDAIYAYYFYRLIQRAENVVLVFNSKTEGMIKGERSRFIYQLMYDPAFIVHEETAGFDINIIHDKEIIISKNAEIINKLLEYATNQDDKYLSPSALNTYLDCSLKFYFRYIAELEEKVEVVEEVDPLMFGNWLHNVMHLLYEPYMSLDLTIKDIEQITSGPERIDEAVLNSYTRNFGYDESVNYVKIEGRNAIISKIIRKYVTCILEIDKQFTPFKIIDLEKMYQMNLSVQTTNGIQNISLGGKIDRIDKTSEGIRIIDYKTGKSSRSFTDIPGLIDRGNKNRNRDAFQALLYAKMVTTGKMITDHQKVIPGLYIIRQFYDDLFDYRLEAGPARRKQVITDYAEIDTHFTEAIAVLLEELFNPEESFRQTDNTEICRTCPYQGICHRETDI